MPLKILTKKQKTMKPAAAALPFNTNIIHSLEQLHIFWHRY